MGTSQSSAAQEKIPDRSYPANNSASPPSGCPMHKPDDQQSQVLACPATSATTQASLQAEELDRTNMVRRVKIVNPSNIFERDTICRCRRQTNFLLRISPFSCLQRGNSRQSQRPGQKTSSGSIPHLKCSGMQC